MLIMSQKDIVLAKVQATDYGLKNKLKWNYVKHRYQQTIQDILEVIQEIRITTIYGITISRFNETG